MKNVINIIGRVGQDPDTINGKNGDFVKLSIATSERWKDKEGQKQEKTTWHNVVVYNKGLVPIVQQYVNKGDLLDITGKQENRKYEKDGQTRYISEVVLQGFNCSLIMLGGSRGGQKPARDDMEAEVGMAEETWD